MSVVKGKRDTSPTEYVFQAPLLVHRTHNRLMNGTFRSDGFYEFNIYERGKARHIRSVTMSGMAI